MTPHFPGKTTIQIRNKRCEPAYRTRLAIYLTAKANAGGNPDPPEVPDEANHPTAIDHSTPPDASRSMDAEDSIANEPPDYSKETHTQAITTAGS